MTQKEVIKWGVHLEAIEKALKGPYVTVTQEVWNSSTEKMKTKRGNNMWQFT